MAKLELDPKNKIVITTDPHAPELDSIVPLIDCQEAIALATRFQQTNQLKFGELLMLLQHLTDENAHERDCPVHEAGFAATVRRRYDDFIHPA